MRGLILFLLVVIGGCSVQGSAIFSQGLVTNWNHDGFKSLKDGVEIMFSVENRDYEKLDETLVGVSTRDRKKELNSAIGEQPFVIKVELKTNRNDIFIQQNAQLILGGKEFAPVSVKKGVDRVISGRESKNIDYSELSDFMRLDHTLDGIDHNWLWLEFDVLTPHPNQNFKLYLYLRNGNKEEKIEANFIAKTMKIYHH